MISSLSVVSAQEMNLKEKALEEFKKERYGQAIQLLEEARGFNHRDPEIYYYLGFFNHYRAYDSRPLEGYDYSYSRRIFEYLNKAIELDPNYGDAKYFYGAECSANAFLAMRDRDVEKLKYYYQKAYEKGAYPDWLLEFGKNILHSCEKDAVLFAGGNADFDVCAYLQLHRDYRKDITLIPIGNIDRPWYVKFLKDGLKGAVKPVQINLRDNQIYDIHPFKWDTAFISISVSNGDIKKYGLEENAELIWKVSPDLISERKHSKIQGEKVEKRAYLSPGKAILMQIVENNFQKRPIFFSNLSNPFFFGGLDLFFSNYGLVSKLTPIKTKDTKFENDFSQMAKLLRKENFENYSNIKVNDIPRISGIVFNYHQTLLKLFVYYQSNNEEQTERLKDFYLKNLYIGYKPGYEKEYLKVLNNDGVNP